MIAQRAAKQKDCERRLSKPAPKRPWRSIGVSAGVRSSSLRFDQSGDELAAGWNPRAPTLKTDGSKRPEPHLGPTVIAKEWTRSLRRVPASISVRSLVDDDLPAGEL